MSRFPGRRCAAMQKQVTLVRVLLAIVPVLIGRQLKFLFDPAQVRLGRFDVGFIAGLEVDPAVVFFDALAVGGVR